MTIDGLIVQRGRKFRVFCLHVCACVFQACVGRRVASARKARGLKCANGGAQKPQLLSCLALATCLGGPEKRQKMTLVSQLDQGP